MTFLKKITGVEEFEEILNRGGAFFLLKHSSTCPISQAGYEEFEKFSTEQQNIETLYLTVQEARPLSNHIAETFHVKHESPQAILFNNHDVVWHGSHWKITYSNLKKALEEIQ